jgi:AcrR family transcriptional regulator
LRSERTKQRIIEGFLKLLMEGTPDPSVAEIARQVGCAVRSIHERFATVKELHGAAAEYAMIQAIALAPLTHADADRPTRIRAQVHTRARTCERTLCLWRLLVAGQKTSPGLREKVKAARNMIGRRLEVMYRPELRALSTDEQRKLLVTLEALTDFESWGLMREHHELSFEDACSIWIGAIDRLLPVAPSTP